jgi:hypothetical protein
MTKPKKRIRCLSTPPPLLLNTTTVREGDALPSVLKKSFASDVSTTPGWTATAASCGPYPAGGDYGGAGEQHLCRACHGMVAATWALIPPQVSCSLVIANSQMATPSEVDHTFLTPPLGNAPIAPPRAAPPLATEPMMSSKMLPCREDRRWAWAEALGEVGPSCMGEGDSMRDPRSMPRTCSRRSKLYERSIKVPTEGSRREQRLRASSRVWTFHTYKYTRMYATFSATSRPRMAFSAYC